MGNVPSTAQPQTNRLDVTTNFQLLRKIDDPHYGEIRLVRDLKTGEQIYLKEIVFDRKDAYQAELIFFNKRLAVSHPNIVRILGSTGSDKQTFCSGYYKISVFIEVLTKTLADEIGVRLQTGIPFSENDILVVAENLIAGLSYFETQNIFHGDIRPENIFATTHSYKLSDPYLSLQKNTNALSHAILGTAKTLVAPQLLIQVPRQDFSIDCNKFKADVFSLGMVLLCMASLTSSEELYDYDRGLLDLYELRNRLEVVRKSYSKFTYDTIRSMLKIKEEERPDFIWLSNRLLPYQEDIRRKSEMQFFGVRAPGEEVDENAEDFFRTAFTELQQQKQADYELEDQLEDAKRTQRSARNVRVQENIEKPNSSRNIRDVQNRTDFEDHSSYNASINTIRLDQQQQIKKRPHGGIFGGVKQGPIADESVEVGMPSHKKQRETQSFVQNQRQQQDTQRQQGQQRQLQQQEEQQRQMQIQQKQMQLQRQRQQEQEQQKQQQLFLEQQRQQEQLLQQQQYEQEQQRQYQFHIQQEQIAQRQNQQRIQDREQMQIKEQNKMSSRMSSEVQQSALSTRQANVEPQSNIKTRSPFGKRDRASDDVQVQGQFQPQIQFHVHNVSQNQIPQIAQLQDPRLVSNQKDYSQQTVEPVPEFDDLETKINAALQRSNTTYNMAYKNLDETAQTSATKPLVIQTQNTYSPANYGGYEAPLTSSGMISMVSPSQRTGENHQSIIDALNMQNIVKNHLPSSAYAKEPAYHQQQGSVRPQQGGNQAYSNYPQQQSRGSEFVTYDANNEEEYGYNYTEGSEGYVIRKHGQTIVLNDF